MLECMGCAATGGNTSDIEPDDFAKGYAVYCFDIEGYLDGTADYGVTKLGDTSIGFEFDKVIPAGEAYQAIVLTENDAMFTLTADREPAIENVA